MFVTPEETAETADWTKAVVAILVVLSVPGVTVGAVGVPVKAGLAKGANVPGPPIARITDALPPAPPVPSPI
jgi:hypothetical protein